MGFEKSCSTSFREGVVPGSGKGVEFGGRDAWGNVIGVRCEESGNLVQVVGSWNGSLMACWRGTSWLARL